MEDRYEIKGKIGQGGLGAVYKAHDIRMNREVAIKRIATNSDDVNLPAEATRQLMKEAGSLASLQHPNIVTIYDVGQDEDGPFVVMELLTGETLEDIIGKGSFTWSDFRQLAMQTLEALIAAQELHLVHRDLKPSNIMLTWLPSGKFQVKIVDFGLAKLSAKPSLQTIDQSDGVFGSIYFMAPEQFERVPIDHKADLYAIGCVFYYALTGTYPFEGDTAAEVMASHLQHHLTALQEVREGIPLWACDWIMWHINRFPADRPESARQALQFFVENDAQPEPALSSGTPALPVEEVPKRPRLLIPGSAPVPEVVKEPTPTQPVKTAAAPMPLAPPAGSKPSVHTTAQVVHKTQKTAPASEKIPTSADPKFAPEASTSSCEPPSVAENPTPTEGVPTLVRAKTAEASQVPILAKRLASGSAATPLLAKTASAATPPLKPIRAPSSSVAKSVSDASAAPTNRASTATSAPPVFAKKKGLSAGMKTTIAIVLGLVAVLLCYIMLKKNGENAEAQLYNGMITYAAKSDASELPVDSRKLEILLRNAASTASSTDRYVIYKALYLAKSTDGTDVDKRIAEFATTQVMIPDVRVVLIRDVLRKRNNPEIIGTLLKFARTTDEKNAAVAAIEATRYMATDETFPEFIEIIQTTQNDLVRKAAEENAAEIIKKSTNKPALASILATAHDAAFNDAIRLSMLRLLGRIGGEKALELAKKNLDSDDAKNKIAAMVALGSWADQPGYKLLVDFIATGPELTFRTRAFDSAIQYATEAKTNIEENWTLLSAQSKTQDEQLKLIRGLANVDPAPWAFTILENITNNSDNDKAIDLAERAIVHLKDIRKTKGASPTEEE